MICNGDFQERRYVTGAPLSHTGHTDLAALAERHWPLPPRLGGEEVVGGERTLMSSVMFSPPVNHQSHIK